MMKRSILFVGLATLAAAPAHASERIDIAVDAMVAAQTCEVKGYAVDREGIASLVAQAQSDAMAAGATEAEAGDLVRSELAFELRRKNEEFARAALMDHALENVERFDRLWDRRCARLSQDTVTSDYFVALH